MIPVIGEHAGQLRQRARSWLSVNAWPRRRVPSGPRGSRCPGSARRTPCSPPVAHLLERFSLPHPSGKTSTPGHGPSPSGMCKVPLLWPSGAGISTSRRRIQLPPRGSSKSSPETYHHGPRGVRGRRSSGHGRRQSLALGLVERDRLPAASVPADRDDARLGRHFPRRGEDGFAGNQARGAQALSLDAHGHLLVWIANLRAQVHFKPDNHKLGSLPRACT